MPSPLPSSSAHLAAQVWRLTCAAVPALLLLAQGCRSLGPGDLPIGAAPVEAVAPSPQSDSAGSLGAVMPGAWLGPTAERGDWAAFHIPALNDPVAAAELNVGEPTIGQNASPTPATPDAAATPATPGTPMPAEATAAAARAPWIVLAMERRDATVQRIVEARRDTALAGDAEWQAWIDAGFPDAVSLIAYDVNPDSGLIDRMLDLRLGAWGDHFENLHTPFRLPGVRVADGRGTFPPVVLPEDWRANDPTPWLGFIGEDTKLPAEGNPTAARRGYALWSAAAKSFADVAGLRQNDIVIRLTPLPYNSPLFGDFRNALDARYRVGDRLTVEWLRPVDGHLEVHTATAGVPAFPLPRRVPDTATAAYVAGWQADADASPERILVEQLTADPAHTAQRDDLYRRLARLSRKTDPYRLPAVIAVQTHPWAVEPLSRDLVGSLPAPGPARLDAQLRWLDRIFLTDSDATPAAPDLPAWRNGDIKAHLDYIEAVLAAAAVEQERAFAAFSDDERRRILVSDGTLLEGFVDAHMMVYDGNGPRQRANLDLLLIADRLDRAALIRQARLAARLTAPDFLTSLRAVMTAADRPGTIASRDTRYGQILLQGSGNDRYTDKNRNPAFLADLGGDDYYANNCGSNMPAPAPVAPPTDPAAPVVVPAFVPAVPTAILIDFAGNDRYESWEDGVMGCGIMGVGLLVDLAGNDTYDARRLAMGAGYFGIGVLEDRGGDDEYRAIDYAMGVGQFGAGVLFDDGGDNRFQSHTASQGVGLTWGVGLLHCTAANGRDLYINKGQYASGYRDAGSWEGWGQGFGTGHRSYASGGLGMLVDDGGDDRYDGGTFSQGGGYYFGMGILDDRAGADEYRGSRYNQGFTAHQAVGVFLDDAGDDRHWQSHHVASGMSWDESVTLFVDQQGDDRYDVPGFGYGAAAMNGFTLFIDRDGADTYTGSRPGDVHGNQYHGGASLGMALDLGGGADNFGSGRKADTTVVDKDIAIFVDAPTLDVATQRATAEAAAAAP